jgi:PHD/YefM family antitoxin component YafN of YafNO toxin-antitoxin module
MRALPDTSSNNNNRLSPNLVRASSFESIQLTTDERQSPRTDDERKRQAKLRNRACNDSFRQAVDKSYAQNVNDEGT